MTTYHCGVCNVDMDSGQQATHLASAQHRANARSGGSIAGSSIDGSSIDGSSIDGSSIDGSSIDGSSGT